MSIIAIFACNANKTAVQPKKLNLQFRRFLIGHTDIQGHVFFFYSYLLSILDSAMYKNSLTICMRPYMPYNLSAISQPSANVGLCVTSSVVGRSSLCSVRST